MSKNCKCNEEYECEDSGSDSSSDECTSNNDCGSDSDLDWNVVINTIKMCKINECGKKKCKKERIIENRSHEQVCFWNQTIPVFLRYYGELSDGSGFESFPLNQPLKFIASGNTLVIQSTAQCVTDSLSFNNGVIIIPPCDQKPQKRPGNCNMTVTFDETAYYIDTTAYESFKLNVGTTIKAINGELVFMDNDVKCLCDLQEYQDILQRNEPIEPPTLSRVIIRRTGTASGDMYRDILRQPPPMRR